MKRKQADTDYPSSPAELWGELSLTPLSLGSVRHGPTRRSWPLMLLITVVILVLITKLADLALLDGPRYRALAEGNRIRGEIQPAPRGIITDRNGVILAENSPDYRAYLTPADLPDSKVGQVAMRLKSLIGVDEEAFRTLWRTHPKSYQRYLVEDGLGREQALGIKLAYDELPGITLEAVPIRYYPEGQLYAHLLGYTGQISEQEYASADHAGYSPADQVGKSGLEASAESVLHGRNGARQVEVDAGSRPIRTLQSLEPIAGSNLSLTVDHRLQAQIYRSLSDMLARSKAKAATAVALNPQTGAVLGYVSLPAFDPNAFAGGISAAAYRKLITDPSRPLLDRALSGNYPPGSTIKPYLAAVALDAGTITASSSINAPAKITVAGQDFPDWRTHGQVDLRRAIAVSSDVYFYGLGGGFSIPGVGELRGLGIERLAAGLRRFAFGAPTGIGLQGESSALVPDSDWKQRVKGEPWYLGDTYHASIGQGDLTVTPMQLVTSLAALANGGTLYRPYLIERTKHPDGAEELTSPEVRRTKIFKTETLQIVREGMRQTVTSGTARPLQGLPVEAAGKTGTAEYGVREGQTHAWFEVFAPYNHPTIALVVLIEGGGESFDAAVPVANEILTSYFKPS